MVVIVIDCAVAVDAVTTILLSLSTVAAKMPLPPLPSAIAAVNDDCHIAINDSGGVEIPKCQ